LNRKAELLARIMAGDYGTDADLAREFNMTRDNVYYYRRRLGIKSQHRGGAHNRRGTPKETRIPITVGVTDPSCRGELRWTKDEVAKFERFFKMRNLTSRAQLLLDAKMGKPEAVQELWERFRMRFLPVPRCQPLRRGGIGDLGNAAA
jgi:hypothetical protein